jgi:hypothetical protein
VIISTAEVRILEEGGVRPREAIGMAISLFGAIVGTSIFLASSSAHADDGDEKCSKYGQIWVDDRETRSWENTNGACVPKGPNGPANGDMRCGLSGRTVKYVAKIDRWLNTNNPCHGGATAGVHLENLHTGTASGAPAGWSGGGVPSPSGGGM